MAFRLRTNFFGVFLNLKNIHFYLLRFSLLQWRSLDIQCSSAKFAIQYLVLRIYGNRIECVKINGFHYFIMLRLSFWRGVNNISSHQHWISHYYYLTRQLMYGTRNETHDIHTYSLNAFVWLVHSSKIGIHLVFGHLLFYLVMRFASKH